MSDTYIKGDADMKVRFYLACLIYPKDVKKPENFSQLKPNDMAEETALETIETIHAILYCYSHEKMRTFTRIPELARLFLIFEGSEAVDEFHSDQKVEESLQDIKSRCEITVAET